MKRYALFGGRFYSEQGGWGDFIASFDTIDQAKEDCKGRVLDWWHVVELSTGLVAAETGA